MSDPAKKPATELSEKDLEQAAGGRVIAPRHDPDYGTGDAIPMWIDADGVRHLGERPGTIYPPAGTDAGADAGDSSDAQGSTRH